MAITLNKGAGKSNTTQQPATAQAAPAAGLGFIKRGEAAKATMAQEDFKKEQRKKDRVYRYWIPDGKQGCITFLDGNLSGGMLDIPFYYEHNVNMNGKYGNFFICTQDTEPCPICEGGLNASYVGVMTIIDHSEYKSQKDGKIHKDEIKLFVAKSETIKLLQQIAAKRGGLRGCTFDVFRSGEMSASVGSAFDFTEKLSEESLVSKYGDKAKPLNYDEVLGAMYISAKDLRAQGFGSSKGPIGGEPPMANEFEKDL